MTQILSNQWILEAAAPLGPPFCAACPIRCKRPWPALARRIAGDGPALPPGSRRSFRAAPGLDRAQLRRSMSIICWLALTISFIPAARRVCLRLFRFLRDDYPRIFQAQIGFVIASLLVLLGLGRARRRRHQRASGLHAPCLGPNMIATMERHEMWTESICRHRADGHEQDHDQQSQLSASRPSPAESSLDWALSTHLLVNGMLLGVVGAACHQYGMSRPAVEFRRSRMDRSNCPRSSSPAARDFVSVTRCCFPARCAGRNLWPKEESKPHGLSPELFLCLLLPDVSRDSFSARSACGAQIHRRRAAVYLAESLAVSFCQAGRDQRLNRIDCA